MQVCTYRKEGNIQQGTWNKKFSIELVQRYSANQKILNPQGFLVVQDPRTNRHRKQMEGTRLLTHNTRSLDIFNTEGLQDRLLGEICAGAAVVSR